MRQSQMANRTVEREETIGESTKDKENPKENPMDCFYSVEFSIDGLNLLYQSRIWKAMSWSSTTASMFALVKENSDILNRIQVGDVLNMKFYSNDSMCPTRNFDTKIEYIKQDQNGRFKGHYLVGLEILPATDPALQSRASHPQRLELRHGFQEDGENRQVPVLGKDAHFSL